MSKMIKKNILSITALIIMYLSLANANTFNKVPTFNIPHLDKIVHFLMYFGLMSAIIFENRTKFEKTSKLFLTGLIPLFYGILMEILQSTITDSRSGSFFDGIFNLTGILISILLWLWIKPYLKNYVR
jgi:VanZ family protein